MRAPWLSPLAALVLVSAAAGAPADRWLHVKVEKPSDGERVHVHLPLSLVEEVLPLVTSDEFHGGKVRIDVDDLEGTDFKGIWAAVSKARDGEYVTVEGTEGDVKVRKAGGVLMIDVKEDKASAAKVRVRIPVKAVDAMFAGAGNEIDVLAALKVLTDEPDGDLVTVEDGDESVRIWVDAVAPAE